MQVVMLRNAPILLISDRHCAARRVHPHPLFGPLCVYALPGILFFAALLLLVPALLRLAALAFLPLAFSAIVCSIVDALELPNDATGSCFVQKSCMRPAHSTLSDASSSPPRSGKKSEQTASGTDTVREQLAKEAKRRGLNTVRGQRRAEEAMRRDLSSVRFEANDQIRIVIAVPGLSSADLDVHVIDNVLHVKGESKKGVSTYSVERRIAIPHNADLNTVKATHALGELVVVMQRKVGGRIPLVQRAAAPRAAGGDEAAVHNACSVEPNRDAVSAGLDSHDAEAADDANANMAVTEAPTTEVAAESDDEWESVPNADVDADEGL